MLNKGLDSYLLGLIFLLLEYIVLYSYILGNTLVINPLSYRA